MGLLGVTLRQVMKYRVYERLLFEGYLPADSTGKISDSAGKIDVYLEIGLVSCHACSLPVTWCHNACNTVA
jgi:hypothetical protein